MSQPKTPSYGGQAVLEGVMFAGQKVNVTAVRRKNSELAYLEVPREDIGWVQALKKIPLLRGIVAILESSVKGTTHLNFSADIFAEEEGDSKASAKEPGFLEKFGLVIGVAVVGILSFLAGKLLFTLVPMFVEYFLFGKLFSNFIIHNLLEGVLKIALLLLYIYLIGLTPPVKRLFQYHGAEHKVISAYEAGVEMTVPNIQQHSRLHYRCGSSFMVLTVIIGVIIYSFPIFEYHSIIERMIQRIALIPVVIGVSYEVLKFTNSVRDIPLLRYLGYPGLWLQKLTTKEPEDSMVEVSLASFNRMMELDKELSVEPARPSFAS
ncbi:DUF1385 domain-containing protein [Gorillibacterium timonense]|uniref:DUF1385 domain-containing protein n=1 Tax=Gorillibacterium timonense TaxID=1689269 RepID=UPI00071E3181|nr:DUF1385 domain-containing protein [Gorillibacterium timonense]